MQKYLTNVPSNRLLIGPGLDAHDNQQTAREMFQTDLPDIGKMLKADILSSRVRICNYYTLWCCESTGRARLKFYKLIRLIPNELFLSQMN